MIRMTYECPETHEPLPSMSTAVWTASDDTAVLVFHCPKCSKRHALSRAHAILAVDAPVGKHDGHSSASSDLMPARERGTSRLDHGRVRGAGDLPPGGGARERLEGDRRLRRSLAASAGNRDDRGAGSPGVANDGHRRRL